MEELPSEIFTEITNHISYVDTISLSWVSKICHQKTRKKNIDLLMRNAISKYLGNNTELFLETLRKSNEYISGSFLLKVLYDENWECDLDIYKFIKRSSLNPMNIRWGVLIDNLLKMNTDIKQGKYGNRYEILGVINRNFILNDFKIDHTIVYNTPELASIKKRNYMDIFDFIETMFDIDICKVVYDGKKLYIKSKYNLVYRYSLAHSRLLNYNRISNYGYIPSTTELLAKMINRIDKYIKRGFNIKKTYEISQILKNDIEDRIFLEKIYRHKFMYYRGSL